MLCKRQHEAGDAPFAVPLPGSHAAARLQRAAPHPRPHRGCLYRSPRLLGLFQQTGAFCKCCRGSSCAGGPPWPTRPCRFGSGASCSGITGLGVRGKKIPQCPEPMPHGPQSCAGCTQLSPRTRAPGRMLQRQRPEQNPGHAGTMT